MKRRVIFTRERESATYRIEVFDANGAAVEPQPGRSYEFCLLAEHFEQIAASDITWIHRGVEPKLSLDALRGCVTYSRRRA